MKKLSPKEIAQHIEETCSISFSEEYIRRKLKEIMAETSQSSPKEDPSGVLVHDEQFLKVKGVEFKRISTVDANNLLF